MRKRSINSLIILAYIQSDEVKISIRIGSHIKEFKNSKMAGSFKTNTSKKRAISLVFDMLDYIHAQ